MARPQLVDLVSTGDIATVEAPAGTGKSTLLDEVVRAHDGPAVHIELTDDRAGRGQLRSGVQASLHRSGLSDLAAAVAADGGREPLDALRAWATDQGEQLLVVLDDLHRADGGLVGSLTRSLADWEPPHRLVLAGRRLPTGLTSSVGSAVAVGGDELRFSADETARLLGREVTSQLDRADIDLLTERCDGWVAAIALAAGPLRRAASGPAGELDREMLALASRPATLPAFIGRLLDPAPAATRRLVQRIAPLPGFDDHVLDAIGLPDGVSALADLGLPLERSHPALWAFPNAVRDVVGTEPPDEPLARVAAGRYLDVGWTAAALRVLEAADLTEELAKLLATLSSSQLGQLDPTEQAAAVDSLPPDLLATHPRILVHLADTYVVNGHLEEYRDTIRRARAIVDARDADEHDSEALEVLAADLTVRAVATDDDSLVTQAQHLLAQPGLPATGRARLLGAIGRATASLRTTAALRDGGRKLEEAARLFQREGAVTHAIATRVIAATVASWPLGRYDAAMEQLDRALEHAAGNRNLRVSIQPYRAFILTELGRDAEAEAALAELRRTASTIGVVGNERSAAFARWGAAKLASQRGDAAATWAACLAVERSDVVVDTGHGAFFRADAAQLLARVGNRDEAERFLLEARARDTGATSLVDVAELTVAAHVGDLERVEAVLAVLAGSGAEPRDRWRVTLLHAYACHRAGDGRAAPLAAAAFEEAAQLGYPDLPMIREPEIARTLLPLAEPNSASARDVHEHRGPRIRLLGRFDVEVDGIVTEPGGRPAELLAYLALNGGQASAEQTIEALWPDGDPDRGRQRLRTVLRRTRRDLGDLVDRHDDLLRLTPTVWVDVDEFQTFVRRARRGATPNTGDAAAALALYEGDAAPSLGNLEWIVDVRHHLLQRALAMHDLVTTQAEEDGRLDDAIRSLLAALELDPTAEDRYLAAARLIAEQGRRSRALQLLAHAREVVTRAGLSPSDELDRLERYLRRDPATSSHQRSRASRDGR